MGTGRSRESHRRSASIQFVPASASILGRKFEKIPRLFGPQVFTRHPTWSAPNLCRELVKFFHCCRSVGAIYIAHVAADRIRCAPVQLLRYPSIEHTTSPFEPRSQRDLPRCGFRLSGRTQQ